MFFALLGLVSAAVQSSNQPPELATCAVTTRASELSFEQLPTVVRADLASRMPAMVDRGQQFQRDDNVREAGLPRRRFIGAMLSDNALIVVYEHGIVDHPHAVRYARRRDLSGAENYTLVPNSNLTGPVCSILNASFSGVQGASAGHF